MINTISDQEIGDYRNHQIKIARQSNFRSSILFENLILLTRDDSIWKLAVKINDGSWLPHIEYDIPGTLFSPYTASLVKFDKICVYFIDTDNSVYVRTTFDDYNVGLSQLVAKKIFIKKKIRNIFHITSSLNKLFKELDGVFHDSNSYRAR